jgi:hypothetical protein
VCVCIYILCVCDEVCVGMTWSCVVNKCIMYVSNNALTHTRTPVQGFNSIRIAPKAARSTAMATMGGLACFSAAPAAMETYSQEEQVCVCLCVSCECTCECVKFIDCVNMRALSSLAHLHIHTHTLRRSGGASKTGARASS